MSGCSCCGSIADIEQVTDRLTKLQDRLTKLRETSSASPEEYPAEKNLQLCSEVDFVAVGKMNGQEGYLLAPIFGFEYWIHWLFPDDVQRPSEGQENRTLILELSFPWPDQVIKRWKFNFTCNEGGGCKADIIEESADRDLFCGYDDRGPHRKFQFSNAQPRSVCFCECSEGDSWCKFRCAVGCTLGIG